MTVLRPDPRGAAGHLAHLVTIPDGSPHVPIVWIGLEGDEIVSGHLPFHRKLRNVQRDPRVSLSIEVGGHNEMGLAKLSRLRDGAHPRRRRRSAPTAGYRLHRAGREVPRTFDPPPGYVLRIAPHRVRGTNLDLRRGGRGRRPRPLQQPGERSAGD